METNVADVTMKKNWPAETTAADARESAHPSAAEISEPLVKLVHSSRNVSSNDTIPSTSILSRYPPLGPSHATLVQKMERKIPEMAATVSSDDAQESGVSTTGIDDIADIPNLLGSTPLNTEFPGPDQRVALLHVNDGHVVCVTYTVASTVEKKEETNGSSDLDINGASCIDSLDAVNSLHERFILDGLTREPLAASTDASSHLQIGTEFSRGVAQTPKPHEQIFIDSS